MRSSLFRFDETGGKQRKTAENSEKERAFLLLFRRQTGQKPRISAANETLLAVNFREKQRKQREQPRGMGFEMTISSKIIMAGLFRSWPVMAGLDPAI